MASDFSRHVDSGFIRPVAKCSLADLTNALGSSGTRLEPVIALAPVAPHRVDAAPVLADARLGAAFIQVFHKERRDEDEEMEEVDPSVPLPWLLTCATLSVWPALHSRRADTHEGTY